MNRKKQVIELVDFYRSLGDAIPNSPPALQEFLKHQQPHVASWLAALGAGRILHDHPEETKDESSLLTDAVLLENLPTISTSPARTIPGMDVVPTIDPDSPAGRCLQRTLNSTNRLASRKNHWWQNWGKQIYCICQKMFFPVSVD